eukprot:GHVU01140863.1.p1 GENE.GHVU01140863.1~~GHVU01140863.1.p1  ORF type:complete len:275 (+),score=39.59 GHVU01140863.1:285-1109(+)
MEGEGRGKLIQRHKIEFKEKCAQWKRLLASAGRQCRKEVESRISKEKEEVLQRHIQELKELGGDVREVPENSEELVSTSAENCEAFGDHEAAAAPKISRAARRRAKKQREQMDTSDEPSAAELEMKRIGDRLKRLGLKLYRVVGDGSCLFHALHHQLKQRHDKDIDVETENGPVTAAALRNMAADCILEHKEEFRPYITEDFQDYLSGLRADEYGGEVEILALSRALRVPILVTADCEEFDSSYGEEFTSPALRVVLHRKMLATSYHYNSVNSG